ncbi:hypothetical protein P9112_001927 [Eukaryota sp. TZLM1-RC]
MSHSSSCYRSLTPIDFTPVEYGDASFFGKLDGLPCDTISLYPSSPVKSFQPPCLPAVLDGSQPTMSNSISQDLLRFSENLAKSCHKDTILSALQSIAVEPEEGVRSVVNTLSHSMSPSMIADFSSILLHKKNGLGVESPLLSQPEPNQPLPVRSSSESLIGFPEHYPFVSEAVQPSTVDTPPFVNQSDPDWDPSFDAASPEPSRCTKSGSRKRRSSTPLPNRKRANHWTAEEDMTLMRAVESFGSQGLWKGWKEISRQVGNGRTGDQCSQRWHRVLRPDIRKGPWSKEEDQSLASAVKICGSKNWKQVATLINGRTDIQCRYRWHRISHRFS